MQDRSQYSAAASLLGYIYQCRLALLESLKRLKSDPDSQGLFLILFVQCLANS